MADDDGATAVAAPTTTNGTVSVNGVAEAETDWRATLPADLKGDKTLERYKSVAELAKGRVEAEKLIGSSIRLPGKDAKPEDVAKAKTDIFGKLKTAGLLEGAPEKPEDYKYQRPEAALSGGWSEEAEKGFVAEAHKHGLTQAQLQGILNWYGGFVGGVQNSLQAQAREVEGKLRTEWGPNYDANLGRANRLMTEIDQQVPGFIDLFTQTGVGRHPLGVKGLVWLAEQMVEHGAMDGSGVANGMGADEATSRIDEMRTNRASPFNNVMHPDHEAAVEEMHRLYRVRDAGRR